ncbi:MAG: GNAT family N-acetyltransferase [Acidobacteriota bacterium]
MTGIRLRDFRSGDLDDAYRLDQACFEPEIAYSRGQIREFLSRPNAIGVVAEIGSGLAGFAIGNRSGTRGHIVTIDVPAGRRRQGVGRALLDELVRRLEQSGARQIRLEVDLRNAAAIAFYESLGFREGRRLRGYYGAGRDGLEMVRSISDEDAPRPR